MIMTREKVQRKTNEIPAKKEKDINTKNPPNGCGVYLSPEK